MNTMSVVQMVHLRRSKGTVQEKGKGVAGAAEGGVPEEARWRDAGAAR